MLYSPTKIPGVLLIEVERMEDERGFFARTWCADEAQNAGLIATFSQCSISFNHKKGTLRGMHWQMSPHGETKLVHCTRGAIYDVALDLRPDSPTFRQWTAHELTAENHATFYIPEGCAHGFQTLEDNSEVSYQISVPFHSSSARGVRWNDPAFNIQWPLAVSCIAQRDANFALIAG